MISLCKKVKIIYNIITCNPEVQANVPEWCLVSEWIILLNWLFLVKWMNQFTKSSWTVWNSLWLEQHRSARFSIKAFQRRLTVTLTQNEPKYWHMWSDDAGFCQLTQCSSHWTKRTLLTQTKDGWASDIHMHESNTWIKGQNLSFYGSSLFMWKDELMKMCSFTLYALDMSNIHVS